MVSVQAGDLSIEVAQFGTPTDKVALLLHGWPDDASTWERAAPILASAGCHVVVPTLRGFGKTRFNDPESPRTGNSGMLALDIVALLDALGIDKVDVAGHDWGSNIAEALAIGWPHRIARIAMLSTPPRLGGMPTPPFWHAQLEWYHWFMATERGAAAIRADRKGFARLHWENWAPKGWFTNETFEAAASSFDNPDWVDITLHSYRSRWNVEPPDIRSQWLEHKIVRTKTLSLPALYIQGELDGVNPPATSQLVGQKFTGQFERIVLAGVGHFPQREMPDEVGRILAEFMTRDASGN